MELKLNQLEQYERRLAEIIRHAEEERKAIRTLIDGINLRQTVGAGNSMPTLDLRRMSIEKAVGVVIDSNSLESYTSLEMTDYLVENGHWTDRDALRPNVGTALRKLWDDNKLTRDNEGTRKKPAFRYRKPQ